MEKLNHYVLVYIPAEMNAWLNEKVKNGYKKASFVRNILQKYKDNEMKWKASRGLANGLEVK